MNDQFTLDRDSLQNLLAAAWVLQCQRDRELHELHSQADALTTPSEKEESRTAVPPQCDAAETARAAGDAHKLETCNVANPSFVPMLAVAAPIYQQAQVLGALALAEDRRCSPVLSPIPIPMSGVFKKAVARANETSTGPGSRRAPLTLVQPPDNRPIVSARIVINSGRISRAMSATVPFVVLVAVATVFSQLASHQPAPASVKAAPQTFKPAVDDGQPRDTARQEQSPAAPGSQGTRIAPPPLEPSHLHVTDPETLSVVKDLSPYDIETLRRQARYGDAVAALTLGMAYEMGQQVPQSCIEAANWVRLAAAEGNSAAQYNLALRYTYGDGTPTNLDEARKWLHQAATHGYRKARLQPSSTACAASPTGCRLQTKSRFRKRRPKSIAYRRGVWGRLAIRP